MVINSIISNICRDVFITARLNERTRRMGWGVFFFPTGGRITAKKKRRKNRKISLPLCDVSDSPSLPPSVCTHALIPAAGTASGSVVFLCKQFSPPTQLLEKLP